MLEKRIENLEKQVAKLTVAIEKLTAVLTTGTTPPPLVPAGAVAAESPECKTEAVAKAVEKQSPTIEDVRRALIDLANGHGREAALSVLGSFAARKVGDLDEHQYGAVIALAETYGQKEAA